MLIPSGVQQGLNLPRHQQNIFLLISWGVQQGLNPSGVQERLSPSVVQQRLNPSRDAQKVLMCQKRQNLALRPQMTTFMKTYCFCHFLELNEVFFGIKTFELYALYGDENLF